MGDERKCMWYDTQAKYEIIQDFFFLRNQKERERGEKEFKTKCFSAHTEMQAPLDGFFPLE